MPVTPSEFSYIQTLIRNHAGLVLDPGKEYLVDSRLDPLARSEGFATIGAMLEKIRLQPLNGTHRKIVDAMTTNETSFFRDIHPFEALKKEIVPGLISRRASERQLNIWCGAASTGQEPYSIAILLREHFPLLASWKIRMLATDINNEVLERARSGRYRQMEVNRGLPAPLLVKYFKDNASIWEIREDIRAMIEFREMNLIQTWWPMPKLDLVFLRNVMIYFDVETKKMILGKIRSLLSPDGFLFLGSAETTLNLDDNFESVMFGKVMCYRLRSAARG
jgi:chemotaxis protein methyltransferase CheR